VLLDRSRPLRFSFEGRGYTGLAGDTLASALAANGVGVLSRSFKYHRPRGLVTARGLDANAYVQLGPVPNVPADAVPLTEGLVATGQNYRGALARDRERWIERFARFLPVGFYYKAFFRPRGAWKRWEPWIRAKAGLGRLDPAAGHAPTPVEHRFCDVAVIGAGPAGLAAARVAAARGQEVVLVDDGPRPGGSLLWDRDAPPVPALPAGVTFLSAATATGLFADHLLSILQDGRLIKLRAGRVVLATGALEQPMVFRGNDLPGVLLASATQRLLRLWAVRPGRAAVVVTANDHGYAAALDLLDAGVAVRRVADLRAEPPASRWREAVRGRGVVVSDGWTVVEAIEGRAAARIEAVTLDRLAGQGRTWGEPETIAADLLVTAAGYAPLAQLACHAGAVLAYDEDLASFTVRGLPAGIRLAGSVRHVWAADAVVRDGEAAGGDRDPTEPAEPVSHPWPIVAHPKRKDFVDIDEDQTVQDLIDATADGFTHVELAKRYSTTGMGPSQGRLSSLNALRIVRRATGAALADTPVTTQRPPFLPEPFAALAGRGHDLVRTTSIHPRHEALGAVMMPAGAWLRPARYGAVAAEVRAVREAVGLIDVGTLGKLEIRGPQAAELLERLLVGRHARQAVGRTRYGLACDPTGAIIDDGVVARLAEDRFLLTATTTGVDALYRGALRWNAEWRLEADLANATAAWAAINLAGPSSRPVLERLEPGCPVDAGSFPYLAVRETTLLGGIPARLLRVGFVGELGFEIHVPAAHGLALWDAAVEAGAGYGIVPFGVEAQRVLRLEKGHIIIGQDTDGLTFPHEVGLEGLIGRDKPFFIGQRAIEVQARRGLTRKLVGFRLPTDATVPPECVLVLKDGRIAGRVTSAARSDACGAVIGLAYVDPADAAPGARIPIKLEDGERLMAEVVATPFYDPANARQAL
jgi:sarcosine oxidase subunit alpha